MSGERITAGLTGKAVLPLLLPAAAPASTESGADAGGMDVAPATFSATGKHPSRVEVMTEA